MANPMKNWLLWYILIGSIAIMAFGSMANLYISGGKRPTSGPNRNKTDLPESSFEATWRAICQKESGGNPWAYNAKEHAVGIAQIRPIMIADVNRILGQNKYTLDDAYDKAKVKEIYIIYQRHYWPQAGPEQWARSWNGGPRGPSKPETLDYWLDVKSIMESQN